MPENETWTVGDVTVTRVVEFAFDQPLDFAAGLFAEGSVDETTEVAWVRPHYLNDEDQFHLNYSQAFLVQTPEKRIVVDLGVGNDKVRQFDLGNTDFLERFSQVWDPASVDYVIQTHFHVDHVGWNTRLVDGTWVPTFPNAEYLFDRGEYDYWQRLAADPSGGDHFTDQVKMLLDWQEVYKDSIEPIVEAGLVRWTEPDAQVTPEVRLRSVPGHTPGHRMVVIESGGETLLLAGDILHFAGQLARPDWLDQLDADTAQGVVSRRAIPDAYADTDVMVAFAHIAPPALNRILRDGEVYRLEPVG